MRHLFDLSDSFDCNFWWIGNHCNNIDIFVYLFCFYFLLWKSTNSLKFALQRLQFVQTKNTMKQIFTRLFPIRNCNAWNLHLTTQKKKWKWNYLHNTTRKFYIHAQQNNIRPRKKGSKISFHLISVRCISQITTLCHPYVHASVAKNKTYVESLVPSLISVLGFGKIWAKSKNVQAKIGRISFQILFFLSFLLYF